MDAREKEVTVYCFDDLGNYTHTETAPEDPQEPGRYLLPPNCTEEAPERTPARWTGKVWLYDFDAVAQQLRTVRTKLLAATDFFMMPDYPINGDDKKDLEKYRQELRDLTKQPGFPEVCVFPEIPTFAQSHHSFIKTVKSL